MALFSKFFGRTISEAAAFALGGAMRSPLEPPLVELTNETWTKFVDAGITVPTEPGDAAEIAAEDVASVPWAKGQAAQRGYGGDQMDKLIGATLNAPDLGTLYSAWRRGEIDDATFTHGLRKARLETLWDTPLKALKAERLAPAQIALGIIRSLLRDPGFLPVDLDTSGGVVPSYPQADIDPVAEAEANGIDSERLRTMVGEIGRPPGPVESARATFRNIIKRADFNRSILEGDIRPEWADTLFEVARQILTAHDYVELRLRGWIDDAAMYAGTALHGMSQADTDLMFKVLGRPLVHNQVFIGKLRGGTFNGPTGDIDPDYLTSLRQSNIRPEWYNLAWAQRYHFPPFFQTINALNKGWIDAATATHWLTVQGYDPDAVKTIVDNVGGTTTASPDKHVTSAQTTTITAIRKAYLGGALTDNAATSQLERAGLAAEAAAGVLAHWQQTKELEALPATPPAT